MPSFVRMWWDLEQPSGWKLHFPWILSVQLQQQPELWVANPEPTARQLLYRGADRRAAPGEPADLWVRLPPAAPWWVLLHICWSVWTPEPYSTGWGYKLHLFYYEGPSSRQRRSCKDLLKCLLLLIFIWKDGVHMWGIFHATEFVATSDERRPDCLVYFRHGWPYLNHELSFSPKILSKKKIPIPNIWK